MNKHLLVAVKAALSAAYDILQVYNSDIAVELKPDQSPLTEADRRSHKVINAILQDTIIPLLSEEGKKIPFKERENWTQFWLIDPLDGTKEFIKRNGEFTVNIALIENRFPVLGVVYVPVKGILYFGSQEVGSYKLTIGPDESISEDVQELIKKAEKLKGKNNNGPYTIVASRSHLSPETEDFISSKKNEYGDVEIISAGSSLKLCLVAEGIANVYPRLAPTMEWDTAAGHAVAKFAGCKVIDYQTGEELQYNKKDLHNPWFIVEGIEKEYARL